ncbi:hypothetical protein AADZ90_005850 [Aestuariibius sp. 2305UL40-4]|uniref:hypothetical protein n=1 Tax=Aestuariibius violaceus TaxID=3234132 RepID=UPI00345F00A7
MAKLRPKTRGPDGHTPEDSPFHPLIEEGYRVFKRPVPAGTGVCECCMDPQIEADFFNHGQQGLPFHYLRDWYFAAADIPLAKDIWAFLLPRILDALAAGEEVSSVGNEVALNRFPTGNPENWTSGEWTVLDRFQRLTLDQHRPGGAYYLDDILCMFGIAGWRVPDLFQQVHAWPIDRLVTQLWHDWCDAKQPGIWIDAFWPDDAPSYPFYTAPDLHDRIHSFALADTTDPFLAEKAIEVAHVIETAPKSPGTSIGPPP